jgi:phage-related protein
MMRKEEFIREIVYYRRYYLDFFHRLSPEVKLEVKRTIYRVFCFFDEGKLIVLMNGFQKKTGKTPRKEIEMAERIKKQYNNEKD